MLREGPEACGTGGEALPWHEETIKVLPSVPKARGRSLMPRIAVFHADNLAVLKALPDACIDLIYIDPPFNTGKAQRRGTLDRTGRSFATDDNLR